MRDVHPNDLPRCPICKDWLLRPGVVWFGESLPLKVLERINHFICDPEPIDLMLVVGTSAVVWPAAGYIDTARSRGARVAIVNTEPPTESSSKLKPGDWFFQGDAKEVVPRILESVIGPTGD